MKTDIIIDVSPFVYSTTHRICGYKGKNLPQGRLGKFFEEQDEIDDVIIDTDYSIKRLLSRFPNFINRVHFCFDPIENRSFRHNIYDEYKAGRTENKKAFNTKEMKKVFIGYKKWLEDNNFSVFEVGSREADDIIHEIAQRNKESSINSIIVSPDGDFVQELSCDGEIFTALYDTNKQQIVVCNGFNLSKVMNTKFVEFGGIFDDDIDADAVKSFFSNAVEKDPKKELLMKIIVGDKSDNIKPCIKYNKGKSIFGVTKTRLEPILENLDFVETTYDFVSSKIMDGLNESLKTKKVSEFFPDRESNKSNYAFNYSLVSLGFHKLTEDESTIIDNNLKESISGDFGRYINLEMAEDQSNDWLD